MTSFLLIAWFARTLFSVLEATSYWQLKEYRWDRMRQFLEQQRGGRGLFFNTFHVCLLLGILAYGVARYLFFAEDFADAWFPLLAAVLFLAETLQYLHRAFTKSLRRPRPTGKAVLIILLNLSLELFVLAFPFLYFQGIPPAFMVALIAAMLCLLDHDFGSFAVTIANVFTAFFKRRLYRQAQEKILSRKDLIVVGITGSYGKTSVKEFLSHILSGSFEVLKTDKNTNTEIGIAQTILKKLHPKHQIFVCEMGAYSKGEIRLCCQISRPKIGIFTGLNEQHVALFGSLDDTFDAKWELITSLPSQGLAVFNGDSPELRKRILPQRVKSIVCSLSHGDATAHDIHVDADQLSFRYLNQHFTAPLVGEFQVLNLLMAIVVAERLGMALPLIAERMKTLAPPEKTMELIPFSRGTMIDDSYNVNPDGLKAALSHLAHFQSATKVLFFPGVLELGKDAPSLHELMGEHIGAAVDILFLTDPSFSDYVSKGALRSGLTRKHLFEGQDQELMIEELQTLFDRDPEEQFVILFESRGAEKVMKWLRERQ